MKNIFKKKNKNVPISLSTPLTDDEKKVVVNYRKSGKFKFYLYKVLKVFGIIFFIVVTFLLGYCSGSSIGTPKTDSISKKGSTIGSRGFYNFSSVSIPLRAPSGIATSYGTYDFRFPFQTENTPIDSNVSVQNFLPTTQGMSGVYSSVGKKYTLWYNVYSTKAQPDDQEVDITFYFYSDYVGDLVKTRLEFQQNRDFIHYTSNFSIGFGQFYCLGENEGQSSIPLSQVQVVRNIDFSQCNYYDVKINDVSISPSGPFGFSLETCNFTGFDLSGNFPDSPYTWQWFKVPFIALKFHQVRSSDFTETDPAFSFRLKWVASLNNQDSYDAGYADGQKNPGGLSSVFGMFSNVATQLGGILNIQLIPGIQVGTILFIPIAGALLVWLIKLIRGA